MLFITGSNGYLNVQSGNATKSTEGKIISLQVGGINRIGSASMYEEQNYAVECKSLSFVGAKNNNIDINCPIDLYIVEDGQGFIVHVPESKVAYISESLEYINRTISDENFSLLETFVKNGYKPALINLNNLILRHPIDTAKLSDDTHGIFDFQYGDNEKNFSLSGVVELASLENRLEGRIFKKRGVLTSVGDFEVNYINPNYTVEDLTPEEFNLIGAIKLSNFEYDKAKLLLVPLLFKTDAQFKAFEAAMKADGRKSVTISRPCIHGFAVQTVLSISNPDDVTDTDITVREIVIFPSTEAPMLLCEEFK